MRTMLERVQALPGVESVGFIDDFFLSGQGNKAITIPGHDVQTVGELNDGVVTPQFFNVMRVPLKQGRGLTSEDVATKIRALWTQVNNGMSLADKERYAVAEPVVVNEAFVKRFFPNENPINKKFCIDPTNKTYWYEIVGVIGDMRRQGLDRQAIPEYYGPYFPGPNGRADLVVRAKAGGDPLALAPSVRSAVKAEVPNIVIPRVSTVDQQLDALSAARRFQTDLLLAFAALALVLAAIGIFGLVHYAVAERSREIGVRMALGATRRDVLAMVIGQGMRMPVLGIVIGLAASAGLTRVIASLLFGVGATDPFVFAAVAAMLALVAMLACYLAARRAATIDPIITLRES
jgi:putative ABC transport system permease protein